MSHGQENNFQMISVSLGQDPTTAWVLVFESNYPALDKLAKKRGVSMTDMANQAIAEFISKNDS